MKLDYLDGLFGNRGVSNQGNKVGDVDLAPRKSFVYGLHQSLLGNLFPKQKPPDHRHSSHQAIDAHAVEASLKRGERKISKLESQINKLECDKFKLKTKVLGQTKVISELTKTTLDQSKEIARLNKIILSQKDEIEEINTNRDAKEEILQWYTQTNDDLCKRLVDTNDELMTLKKSVHNSNIV